MSSSAKAFHDDQQDYMRLCEKYGEKPELGGLLNEPYPWGRHYESLRRRELSEPPVKDSLTPEQPEDGAVAGRIIMPEQCGSLALDWQNADNARRQMEGLNASLEEGEFPVSVEYAYPASVKAERDALAAKVRELEADAARALEKLLTASEELKKDLLMRAEKDEDGCLVVDASHGRWEAFKEAIDEASLLLRGRGDG